MRNKLGCGKGGRGDSSSIMESPQPHPLAGTNRVTAHDSTVSFGTCNEH